MSEPEIPAGTLIDAHFATKSAATAFPPSLAGEGADRDRGKQTCASTGAGTETDHDQAAQARSGPARAVFAGRLRAAADETIADGGPNAGSPTTSIAPPAHPPPSASVLRDLIDKPGTAPMVWVHHPVTGTRLFKLPVELPDHWLETADARPGDPAGGAAGQGEVGPVASEPAELPPLTAQTVLRELARIAFTDPLPPGKRAGTRLPVTLRDKQNALLHLGRHFGLFSGRRPTSRPYAELSDDDLKARSDEVIRALAGMGVEVRIADDGAGAQDGAPLPP